MNLSHNKDLYVELFTQIARMHDEVNYGKHLSVYKVNVLFPASVNEKLMRTKSKNMLR